MHTKFVAPFTYRLSLPKESDQNSEKNDLCTSDDPYLSHLKVYQNSLAGDRDKDVKN